MKKKIDELKQLGENIQAAKLGKRGKEVHANSYTVIDEYHKWQTESEDILGNYFSEKNSLFQKFKDATEEGNGHVLMHAFNIQYPIFQLLIRKIESGEAEIKSKTQNPSSMAEVKGKTIFISHASKDKEIAEAFLDIILHGALSVPINEIFCSSTDGTKIKSGADWRDSIKTNLLSAQINFLIITPNYKESEVCMNEMGAA